jgi:hypothetical protein
LNKAIKIDDLPRSCSGFRIAHFGFDSGSFIVIAQERCNLSRCVQDTLGLAASGLPPGTPQ